MPGIPEKKLLENSLPPTAVFAAYDNIAIGCNAGDTRGRDEDSSGYFDREY